MRATGREVKLAPSDRATGGARKMELAGLTATPGYEVMLLRDDKLQPLTWNSVTSNRGNPSYFSYDTLLKENKVVYEGLRQELFATIGRVMSNDFPKQEYRSSSRRRTVAAISRPEGYRTAKITLGFFNLNASS